MLKTAIKNSYELLVVYRSTLSEKSLLEAVQQIESAIKNYGGHVTKISEPQRKKFTHKMGNFKDGYYISILFEAPPELPNTLKRTLSIADDILRYSLIRKEK